MALFADLSALSSMSKEKASRNMDEARNYISLDIGNIARCMKPYHPLEVLKMAAWEERRMARSRAKDPEAQLVAHLLPVLLQSVVQCTVYDVSSGISSNRAIKQKDWNRIVSLVEDVVRRMIRFIDAYTVYVVRSGKIMEEDAESYRDTIAEQLFPPAESSDSINRSIYLWYGSMASDPAKCMELFGVNPEKLAEELYKVSRQGVEGIDRLTEDISVYKAEMMLLMAQKRSDGRYAEKSEDELRDIIVHEEGWEGRVSRLAGQRDDFDLFRPEFVSDLPEKAYETLSVYPGTLDMENFLTKGPWPSTVFPFIRFGGMYFSFVSGHILFYGERILAENASLYLTDTEAAYNVCSLIFSKTGVPEVYSFDGNKIDIRVISSLTEVNAYQSPEFYAARLIRRREDANVKPMPGHRLLFIDPDGFSELKQLDDNVFSTSVYQLFRAARDKELRSELLRTIFGKLDLGETDAVSELLEEADEDYIDYSQEADETIDDPVSDEYEYDTQDDDEKERELEEKEKSLEEDIPDYTVSGRSEEIRALQDKYELTPDIIEKDQKMEREADEYEKELDDDDYIYDDQLYYDDPDPDPEPEDEPLYDEAEKEDEYEKPQPVQDDPDQLSFLDELLSETVSELDAEDEERSYISAEDEAARFAETGEEKIQEPVLEKASEEDEADDPLKNDEEPEEEEHTEIDIPDTTGIESFDTVLPSEFAEKEYSAPEPHVVIIPETVVRDAFEIQLLLSFEEKPYEVPVCEKEEPVSESAETLVDKGIVRKVETEDGGSLFVMSGTADAPVVPEEDDEEETEETLELDGILADIASRLEPDSAFMNFLRAADREMLEYLSRVIRTSWEKQQADGKDKMFSVFDYSISVILASPNAVRDELRKEELLNNAGAVMYSKHKTEWNALILLIDTAYELEEAEETVITPSSFSPSNWKICTIIGEQLIQRGR